jgi:formamidase
MSIERRWRTSMALSSPLAEHNLGGRSNGEDDVVHAIRIDRNKPLAAEPHLGHNRYHPDIPPVAEIGEGEEIALETRDALDGQIRPGMAGADLATIEAGVVHPLTGPVFVKGAQPGDMLEIEFTDIIAQPTAFSAIIPGLGFLRDVFTEPFLVHWRIADGWATSPQLPGVRIPGAPFMGVSAVAPSPAKLAEWTAREQRVIDRGGFAFLPTPPARCRPARAGWPGCGRCRRAKTAAISTPSN